MVIWIIIATIYVIAHLSYLIFLFGMKRRDFILKEWMNVYHQQLSWLKNSFKYIFFILRNTFHSLLRKYVKEEFQKDQDQALNKEFLDYLISYYDNQVDRIASIINFVYEYKFARFYRKQRKNATFPDLLHARSRSLENNYNDLAYIMKKTYAEGRLIPEIEKEWQRHLKRSRLFTEQSLKNIEKRREVRFREEANFAQHVEQQRSSD